MKPWLARLLFYGGTLLVVTIMCQDVVRELSTTLLGEDTGGSLFSFIRTNVEAPISVIVLAIYLDVVLARKTRADLARGFPAFSASAVIFSAATVSLTTSAKSRSIGGNSGIGLKVRDSAPERESFATTDQSSSAIQSGARAFSFFPSPGCRSPR